MWLAGLVLYVTLGLVLTTLNCDIFAWQFWSVIALFWANGKIIQIQVEQELLDTLDSIKTKMEAALKEAMEKRNGK